MCSKPVELIFIRQSSHFPCSVSFGQSISRMAVSVKRFPRLIICKSRQEQHPISDESAYIYTMLDTAETQPVGKGNSCTHSKLVFDRTSNFTLRLHGFLPFDRSCKVDLRWLGLSEQTENKQYQYESQHSCVGVFGAMSYMYVYVSYPDTDSCSKMATFALAFTGSIFCCSLVL